jgi:hypothetical protein
MRRTIAVACGIALVFALLFAGLSRAARADEEVHPTFERLEAGDDPLATYKLNTFGLVHTEISGPLLVFGGVWWRPTRGKFREATSYDDFFRALGRPDLAERHSRRRLIAGTLLWGGLLAELAGVVLFFKGFDDDGFATQARVGVGLLAGGFAARAVGATVQHPAISEEEAADMVAAYNQRLRVHLGLRELSLARAQPLPGVTVQGRW